MQEKAQARRHHHLPPAQFAYVRGQLPDGTVLPTFQLRYADSASSWALPWTRLATTTTEICSCRADIPPTPARKPSTAPAASTSAAAPDELVGAQLVVQGSAAPCPPVHD